MFDGLERNMCIRGKARSSSMGKRETWPAGSLLVMEERQKGLRNSYSPISKSQEAANRANARPSRTPRGGWAATGRVLTYGPVRID